MVVADGKASLVRQGQLRGKIANAVHDLANALFQIHRAPTIVQLGKMVVLQFQQGREHRHRRARCRAVITVTYGGVDPRISFLLDFLQHGEQPAQPIADVSYWLRPKTFVSSSFISGLA